MNKLTISEFIVIASNANLTINWVSYFISRPNLIRPRMLTIFFKCFFLEFALHTDFEKAFLPIKRQLMIKIAVMLLTMVP